ncbi:dihydroorotase [Miniphocaeibacter halophilus]|uniref:Amidohydrolase family protein n=1 Tax=Miniphocaeibacter halophilus TaxID=2931922 RepID=A0AC61MS00_9FIRM|nr:amidohydrolase family protein [Miniphocaeibacter halophilus]QQK08394.1 amidohydrolase family protein [Miniphocaeibacter halophilus]
MKTLFKNGLVYNSLNKKFIKKDILISGEKIEKIENNINDFEIKTINCENKFIIPGGIDAHTHLDHNMGDGLITIDDFKMGTKAALYGGTTSIIDHVSYGNKNNNILKIINDYHKKAKDSYIDYSFHGVAFKNDNRTLDELKELKNLGISSVKIYTVYGEKLEDEWILKLLTIAKEEDITVCVHCENEEIINYSENIHGEKVSDFPLSRPVEAEAETVERLIYYSKITGYPKLYFVHISSKESLENIIRAKEKGHKNLFVETCIQYLTFTDEVYSREEGGKYICSPPLRKKEDVDFLWKNIEKENIDVIATDHCPFSLDKKLGIENYKNIAGGVPGIEERILVTLSESEKRNIEITKVIDKLSTNPAQIFNLKNKGTLEIGKDADIVILSKKNWKFKNIHGNSQYSIYDNRKLNYTVDAIYIRGNKILEKEKILDEDFKGKFIKR